MTGCWKGGGIRMVRVLEFVFFLSLAALLYVYIGYPLLLVLISRFFRRRLPEKNHEPFLSILIAAYNEEVGIRKKLEQTLPLEYPAEKMEVIALSDGSTDGTD